MGTPHRRMSKKKRMLFDFVDTEEDGDDEDDENEYDDEDDHY